jgi:5'-3' exonuclease
VNWYKHATQLPAESLKEGDLPKEFLEKYDKTFENSIVELSKTYAVPTTNMVFAKDCPRDKIWRTSLFPTYKANRDDKDTCFNRMIFKHTFDVLFPILRKKYGFHELYHPRLEADDCVALFVQALRNNYRNTITIITNDNDYIQLYKHNVNIINLQGKNLRDRVSDVATYIQLKTVLGDKSDNIPAIAKKVGEKTAQKIISNPELMSKYLHDPEVLERYLLNSTLVNFENIPIEHSREFIKSAKDLLEKTT